MEQSVSERKPTITPTADFDVMGALDWKDGIATLPGSNIQVQGYRMRLHFDGYSEYYDFWVNADSPDIHPVGWCEKTGHKLLSPKGYKEGEFNWVLYLKNCKAQAAPKNLFKTLNTPVTPSGFRVGMKLEAVDKKNPSLMCVASIADMLDNRLLIHFDNWDESYDYWCDASSPYIRPVGYCQETGTPLTTPPEYKDSKSFSWEKYLEETSSQAAPARAFKLRPAHGFQVNTKLEAVDRRNPMLIRVATIAEKEDHRIKIHFDGWEHSYDFWVDADSFDIHPVGWLVGCPYSEVNLNRESSLQDRLSGERPSPSNSVQKPKRPETPAPFIDPQEDSPQSSPRWPGIANRSQWELRLAEPADATDTEFALQQALHQSVFMPSLSSSPTHRLHLCWEQHCRLLPEVSGLTARSVAKWTVEEA
ncbi:Lethal(3)malignant brain tumor-like protein 3 [Chelonia mydas]|uniref:Lethal(3)malignant brain tumor-like protein 3 n=1 Tax=Chelonia mydas TaxID=8469 RepID=M7BGA0_CHEMY|nr:Lethal(3)malignant brain tumor-like protein 3 [Chelonia mydas]